MPQFVTTTDNGNDATQRHSETELIPSFDSNRMEEDGPAWNSFHNLVGGGGGVLSAFVTLSSDC